VFESERDKRSRSRSSLAEQQLRHPLRRIRETVISTLRRCPSPGLAISVAQHNDVLFEASIGKSNVELNVPMDFDAMFKLGSVSKPIIAAAILTLVEEQKLRLNDRVADIVDAPASWDSVLIWHLLAHTSGLQREPPGFDPYLDRAIGDYVKRSFDIPLQFAPGCSWSYSNLGYFVLWTVIERLTLASPAVFINRRIFRPAQMSQTRTTSVFALIPCRAAGYLAKGAMLYNAGDLIAFRPSGAFVATAGDLAKFLCAIHNGTIISKISYDSMTAAARLNDGASCPYGLGWELDDLGGTRLIHHGGALWGFKAEIARVPQVDLSIVVLANCDTFDSTQLAIDIACDVLGTEHLMATSQFNAAWKAAAATERR
jgi:CubicO group peptidase (beta-lactamase class C family)